VNDVTVRDLIGLTLS